MPPLYRRIRPNIPWLTEGNGKPCYQGLKPSRQALMRGYASWIGAPDLSGWMYYDDIPHPPIETWQINAVVSRTTTDDAQFYYNGVQSDEYGLYRVGKYTGNVQITSELQLRVAIAVDLVYTETGWFWEARCVMFHMHFVSAGAGDNMCVMQHQAIFRSSLPEEQSGFRLGELSTDSRVLDFVGFDNPWTRDVELWINNAFIGCSIEIWAAYA